MTCSDFFQRYREPIYEHCLRWCYDFANKSHTHKTIYQPFSGTTQVSRYQKGNTNLDFTEARDGEWQWHQLGHVQVCTYLQTDNHASTPPLRFLQAACPSCRPTNSIKALKADSLLHASWQDFNWQGTSRGPSAIAELLVKTPHYCSKQGSHTVSELRTNFSFYNET